jgi:hypothetical protein
MCSAAGNSVDVLGESFAARESVLEWPPAALLIENSLIFLCTVGKEAYAVSAEVVSPSTPLLA